MNINAVVDIQDKEAGRWEGHLPGTSTSAHPPPVVDDPDGPTGSKTQEGLVQSS